jgi:hypothetical protein
MHIKQNENTATTDSEHIDVVIIKLRKEKIARSKTVAEAKRIGIDLMAGMDVAEKFLCEWALNRDTPTLAKFSSLSRMELRRRNWFISGGGNQS